MSTAAPVTDREQLQAKLKTMAEEISTDLSRLGSTQGKELLSDFVSELFLNMAKQGQQEFRRERQAQGIAAAKARGVQFGRTRKPLPENFDEYYEAWRNGEMTMTRAAEACGISRTAFYREINRLKQDEGCSV